MREVRLCSEGAAQLGKPLLCSIPEDSGCITTAVSSYSCCNFILSWASASALLKDWLRWHLHHEMFKAENILAACASVDITSRAMRKPECTHSCPHIPPLWALLWHNWQHQSGYGCFIAAGPPLPAQGWEIHLEIQVALFLTHTAAYKPIRRKRGQRQKVLLFLPAPIHCCTHWPVQVTTPPPLQAPSQGTERGTTGHHPWRPSSLKGSCTSLHHWAFPQPAKGRHSAGGICSCRTGVCLILCLTSAACFQTVPISAHNDAADPLAQCCIWPQWTHMRVGKDRQVQQGAAVRFTEVHTCAGEHWIDSIAEPDTSTRAAMEAVQCQCCKYGGIRES